MTPDTMPALPVALTERLAMYAIHYGPASSALFRDAIEAYARAYAAAPAGDAYDPDDLYRAIGRGEFEGKLLRASTHPDPDA